MLPREKSGQFEGKIWRYHHGDEAGPGRRHQSPAGARARPGRCRRAVPVRSDCVAARVPPASRGASALTGLATYAVPWPTAHRRLSVTRPPNRGRGAWPGVACPGRARPPAGLARDWSHTRRQTARRGSRWPRVHPPTTPGGGCGGGGRGQDGQRDPVTGGPFLLPAPARPAYSLYIYPSLSHFCRSAATRR